MHHCTVRRAVHDYGLPHTAATSPKQSTTRDETVTQSLSLPRCQQHPLPSTAPNTMHSDALQYLLNDKYILIYVIIYCFIKIEMRKSEISLAELALIPIPAFLDPKNILYWDCCRGDKQAPRCGPSRAVGARNEKWEFLRVSKFQQTLYPRSEVSKAEITPWSFIMC